MAQENKAQSEIRYLNPVSVDVKKKKYCRFKKLGIKYVDYKDGEFLKKFLNEQGKILPRRLTGTSQKFQKKVAPGREACASPRHPALRNRLHEIIKGGRDNGSYSDQRYGKPGLRQRHRDRKARLCEQLPDSPGLRKGCHRIRQEGARREPPPACPQGRQDPCRRTGTRRDHR